MKTKKNSSLLATLAISCALFLCLISCSKTQKQLGPVEDDVVPAVQQSAAQVSGTGEPVNFCSIDSIPLCWKNSQQDLSWVQIKRGSDHQVYVTFTATGMFYFKQLNLYCGAPNAIPNQLANFPNKITFATPFPYQTYTFVIPNLPDAFTVVGYAVVVKKASNGNITGNVKYGWVNTCSNLNVCSLLSGSCGDLSGGSYYNYTSAGCFPAAPPPPAILTQSAAEEPNTCSKAIDHFLGIDPAYGTELAWPIPDVTAGGYTYTEAEARSIAAATGQPDSKYAMMRVVTLKLSKTNYTASPTLAPAVTTIENWLSTIGKLSPTSLPDGNTEVRNAAELIDSWIGQHICPERR